MPLNAEDEATAAMQIEQQALVTKRLELRLGRRLGQTSSAA